MSSPPSTVVQVSKSLVQPSPPTANQFVHLPPWDLFLLSIHYIQKGLLFSNLPSTHPVDAVIHTLKSSLSVALAHFYPLAGRLVTHRVLDHNNQVTGLQVSIDCSGQGAEFTHAVASSLTVSDVLAPLADVPSFVRCFFPLTGVVGHDGHSLPLLAVQLTELSDGVFVACSFNHVVGDGTSYWHFLNSWAEIARSKDGDVAISRPPVHDRWFIDGETPPVTLPFSSSDEFIQRYEQPPMRERIFHFSSQTIARLKARANAESGTNTISSFQALSSLVWRSITRAGRLPPTQMTCCRLAIGNRARLRPPLSPDYFGNSVYVILATTTAGELLAHGLGWAALLLHQSIAQYDDAKIREIVKQFHVKPFFPTVTQPDQYTVHMGSSPRFNKYGCEFGWGRAVALRSGAANKFDGKVSSYPGREGGGSVDLEVCLLPEYMALLELDEEFMAAASSPPQ